MGRVVVGIVTYNSADHLEACYQGLLGQRATDRSPLQTEVLFYDNASHDSTIDIIRRLAPDAPLITSTINRGYGAAHNALIAAAHLQAGDFYLALNPDAVLHPDYIASLIEALQRDPRNGWATGHLYIDETHLYSVGHAMQRDGYTINIGAGMTILGLACQTPTPSHAFEVFGAPGAAVLIKAELLNDLKTAFDETFFVYLEDVDFDWRARRRGWRCWSVPQAKGFHTGSTANAESQARAVVNRWLMIIKNASTRDLLLYHPLHWMAHVLVRLITTPCQALWMVRQFFHLLPLAWQVRRADPPPFHDPEMDRWFQWAKTQSTGQAHTYRERWQHFINRKKRVPDQASRAETP